MRLSRSTMRLPTSALRNRIRNILYPGLDLHTRNRASLSCFWQIGPRDVLDAGSGNGYFSWLAYQTGARVVALNYEQEQVEKARDFLIGHRRADPARLQFEQCNLYCLNNETRTFDEVICFEVLEHLLRDREVVTEFYRILRPGGVLHLCCPHRLHPRHQAEVLDERESGGHVRAGYTEDEYRKLLEPIGFHVDFVVGIGTPAVYHADRILRVIRNRIGDWAALPLLPIALPAVWFATPNPRTPFSLYVKAVKQAGVA
ncbi:MAG TPA: methyltransferase domain-containing protein [Candidatus Sulfotelmatobacter sp.]